MDKNKALQLFYERNNIDILKTSDITDGNFDVRIAQLSDQIDRWLVNISPSDHNLFLTLLSKFTYLTNAQCQLRYSKIISLLEEQLNNSSLSLYDVLIVTVESSSPFKSGSDNVRADLHKRNLLKLSKSQIVASQTNLQYEDIQQYKVVLFLDDVVGSGRTLWRGIKSFCDRFSINGNGCPQLYYGCIAPRERGMQHLRDNCLHAKICATPLFDETWYEKPAFDKGSDEYTQIESYEQLVGNYLMEPPESFFMGFEKNRMLLSFHYNTPNNTLSTFWRVVPEKNDPPFLRDGNQGMRRPTIDALKIRDADMRNHAYAFGQDFWRRYQNG